LVVFEPCTPGEHYERYFGLAESLEALFGRRVDLVEANAMRNPYPIRRANATRTPLYAA
jgi:predicted nucleotidyltransferase